MLILSCHTIATLQWLFLIGKTDTKPTELCLQQNIAVYLSLHNPTSPSIYLNSTSACNCIHLPACLLSIHFPLKPREVEHQTKTRPGDRTKRSSGSVWPFSNPGLAGERLDMDSHQTAPHLSDQPRLEFFMSRENAEHFWLKTYGGQGGSSV